MNTKNNPVLDVLKSAYPEANPESCLVVEKNQLAKLYGKRKSKKLQPIVLFSGNGKLYTVGLFSLYESLFINYPGDEK